MSEINVLTVVKSLIHARMKTCLKHVTEKFVFSDATMVDHIYDNDGHISNQSTTVDFKPSFALENKSFDVSDTRQFMYEVSNGFMPLAVVVLVQIYVKMNNDIMCEVTKTLAKLEKFDLLHAIYTDSMAPRVLVLQDSCGGGGAPRLLVTSYIGSHIGEIISDVECKKEITQCK